MRKEEALTELLEKDEQILWSGKPAPFEIKDKYLPKLIRNYIITLIIFVPVLIFAMVQKANDANVNLNMLLIVFVIILVVLPLGGFSYTGYRKNCDYYLTNKNIIVYLSESKRMKYPYKDINEMETVPQSEGTKSIRIGTIVGKPNKNNLDYAINCVYMGTNGENKGYCLLFNLLEKDAEIVLELINKHKKIDKVIA